MITELSASVVAQATTNADKSVFSPGVDVEDRIQGLTRCGLERVAKVVGGGNQGAMPDVGRDAQEFRDRFMIAAQVCEVSKLVQYRNVVI